MTYLLALSILANACIVVAFARFYAAREDTWAKERDRLLTRIQSPERVIHEPPEVDDTPSIGFENDEAYWEAVKQNGSS